MSDDVLADLLDSIPFGYSLDYRRSECGWPKPYRFRVLPNKNERADYRVTGYGYSAEEAVRAAIAAMPPWVLDLAPLA